MVEQWVDVYQAYQAIADAKGLVGVDRKAFLAGYHLRNVAKSIGWTDDDAEGAYEYIMRRQAEIYEEKIAELNKTIGNLYKSISDLSYQIDNLNMEVDSLHGHIYNDYY